MEIRNILNESMKVEFDKNSLSHNNNIKKAKRIRSAFTTNQIMYLENEFLNSPYVGVISRKEIASKLNIPERAVKIWFQNRRMKEKKDVVNRQAEFHHYDKTEHNRFVNDQLSNVETLQSNNKLCSHSVLPQPNLLTNLNDSNTHFHKKNCKRVPNSTKNIEIEMKPVDGVVVTHHFQNSTITSSTNEAKRNAQLSLELLKKYKNHVNPNPMKKAVKTKGLPSKHNDLKKRKLNGQSIEQKTSNSESRTAPSITKQQQTITQVPSGYIPFYPQHRQQYPPPGNFIWKPIDPMEMGAIMPMCDFAILPNTITHPTPKGNSQCSCNCHMKSQNMSFPHENQPHYVIAVPYHKPSLQFTSPI